jgi:TetR/AcrR family transcriptional repressor of nem operon
MSTKTDKKQCTRTALLEAGIDLMIQKGYAGTGIQEILKASSIPKGCFYHYFDSKEHFALEIIRHFDQGFTSEVLSVLRNPERKPLDRLRDYCETTRKHLEQDKNGCPIAVLSQEMSAQSEVLRAELCTVLGRWRDAITECIEEGQKIGEIRTDCDARQLAEVLASAWAGAKMRAKTCKSSEPTDAVIDVLIGHCLKP